MNTPVETARAFDAAIAAGDVGTMTQLLAPDMSESLVDGCSVVSLRSFLCVHRPTQERQDLDYPHLWDVKDQEIGCHRQYIDTLAVEEVRRS